MKQEKKNIQQCRKEYIYRMAEDVNSLERVEEFAEDLFELDLTVYSSNYTLDSLIYNAFAISEIDDNISLHPEQIKIINEIESNNALIVSAPTSFGKTFCVFEYIVKYKPLNVVLIVPTLALLEEYYKKIIKRYKDKFADYKVYTNIREEKEYDFNKNNIFILTHERVVQTSIFSKLEKIDFLVIDEVYKLETDKSDDRVLVLNMAYYYLAKKADKYVLLAPFIKNIENYDMLEKNPKFYKSDYSPVVNEIITKEINNEDERIQKCSELVKDLKSKKTLIYFATVTGMYNYINDIISKEEESKSIPDDVKKFIDWAEDEIHEEWCVIKALKCGYLIHNGQIPIGTRIFQLNQYGNNEGFDKMLCTSTLLEGVNTTAENIIIVQAARKRAKEGENFSAFDFFNLVGRTGRLNEHLIGRAYYIKGPKDRIFQFKDAIKSIKFEILDNTDDMDIQLKKIDKNMAVNEFLDELGISLDDYLTNIGTKLRFNTVKDMYMRFQLEKSKLEDCLKEFLLNKKKGRFDLVKILYKISDDKNNKLDSSIINALLHKKRPKIKNIVDNIKKSYPNVDINIIISKCIKMKNSYIEHGFYNKITIIKFFCELDEWDNDVINVLVEKIMQPIESLYFMSVKNKKSLLDLGIYERDIDKIIKIIGDDFEDATELKNRLIEAYDKLKGISFISKYVIQNLK